MPHKLQKTIDVQQARLQDMDAWMVLAKEVEPLFGPLVSNPGFHDALRRCIEQGSAFCLREGGGGPGVPLQAGLLFAADPPVYQIGWLAVASRHQRRGLGRALVLHAFGLVRPPAEMTVKTFGPDAVEGVPARRLYEALGFAAAEMSEPGPDGASRQIFRRTFEAR